MIEELPVRVQRKRSKGWRMPPNTIYVGRPSIWCNMFPVGKPDQIGGSIVVGNRASAARMFKNFINGESLYGKFNKAEFVKVVRHELKGKNLACWCPLDEPCHADYLLELANA